MLEILVVSFPRIWARSVSIKSLCPVVTSVIKAFYYKFGWCEHRPNLFVVIDVAPPVRILTSISHPCPISYFEKVMVMLQGYYDFLVSFEAARADSLRTYMDMLLMNLDRP